MEKLEIPSVFGRCDAVSLLVNAVPTCTWSGAFQVILIVMLIFQMRCFVDFEPGNGLCQILSAAYKFKTDHALRRFDLQVSWI